MTTPSSGALAVAAESYLEAGLCALPAIRNGDVKRPAVGSWKAYQSHRPTFDEIRQSFEEPNPTNSMCVVCGAISQNLEMIDFDLAGEAFEPWKKLVKTKARGLFDRLVIETSPSGGYHVVYRCEVEVCGNMKLAQRRIECDDAEQLVVASKSYTPRQDAGGKWHILVTMIETRGEGGLFLCAPSPGYEIVQGDLRQPPVLTADDRTALLECAWALDENKQDLAVGLNVDTGINPSVSTTASCDPLKPGDDFNRRGDVREILIAAGWKPNRTTADGNEHWTRPGKANGTSATLKDENGVPLFFVHSTNAPPFEAGKAYSPFAVFALLEHNGDYAAAASALGAKGYAQTPDTISDAQLATFIESSPTSAPNGDTAQPTPVQQAGIIRRPKIVLVGELVKQYPKMRPPVIHGLLREGETMNIIAAPKVGKALDINTPIMTDHGWETMGTVQPGMKVHACDGTLTTVVAATEIMTNRPCCRVTTKSGASVIADEDHLWSVVSRNYQATVPTRDLHLGHRGRRWKVPVAKPLQRPHVSLPIDPWLLGYWLGNGTSCEGSITVNTLDFEHVCSRVKAAGFAIGSIRRKPGAATFCVLGLQRILRQCNLLRNKRIPAAYTTASQRQRSELLAGLLDSDGYATTAPNDSGAVEFSSTSEQLARETLTLIRSLGHKASFIVTRAKLNGEDYGLSVRIWFTASRGASPFSSPRKTNALPARTPAARSYRDAIVSIEAEPSTPVRCIQVAHPSGTYLAGEMFLVTHNSWLSLDLAIAVARGEKWLERYDTVAGKVLIVDNELHKETTAHRIPLVADARNVPMRQIAYRVGVDNVRGDVCDIHQMESQYFAHIEPGEYKLILLDAFYRFLPAGESENDNAAMKNAFNTLDRIAGRLKCCIVLIHHASKGSQAGKDITDVGAGAGSQSRAADSHLILRPHEEEHVVVLEAVARSWEPIEPVCLRWKFPVWNVDAALDPADLKTGRQKKRKDDGDDGADESAWTAERFVDEFVTADPISLANIKENALREAGLSRQWVTRLLDIAERDGLVERVKMPGRGGPTGYMKRPKKEGEK